MPKPETSPPTRGVVLRGVGFGLAVALGAVAVWLIVTSTTQKRLELGVLAGLWGLLLGAFCLFGSRRGVADDRYPAGAEHGEGGRSTGAGLELRSTATQVERAEEVAARRAHEARIEELLRQEIRNAVNQEVGTLRAEIAQLRTDLLEKVGGQLRLEHIETTRVIGSDLEALQDEIRALKATGRDQDLEPATIRELGRARLYPGDRTVTTTEAGHRAARSGRLVEVESSVVKTAVVDAAKAAPAPDGRTNRPDVDSSGSPTDRFAPVPSLSAGVAGRGSGGGPEPTPAGAGAAVREPASSSPASGQPSQQPARQQPARQQPVGKQSPRREMPPEPRSEPPVRPPSAQRPTSTGTPATPEQSRPQQDSPQQSRPQQGNPRQSRPQQSGPEKGNPQKSSPVQERPQEAAQAGAGSDAQAEDIFAGLPRLSRFIDDSASPATGHRRTGESEVAPPGYLGRRRTADGGPSAAPTRDEPARTPTSDPPSPEPARSGGAHESEGPPADDAAQNPRAAGGGRRRRADDSTDDLLAKLLAREKH